MSLLARGIRHAASVAGQLPQFPLSAAVAMALNAGIGGRMDAETLDAMRDKVLRIAARDIGVRVTLTYRGRSFHPRPSSRTADVTISATLDDFARLATRREDPDSLFFARRLLIEGDTELGLRIKNALDALDLERIVRHIEPIAAALLSEAKDTDEIDPRSGMSGDAARERRLR
ncbi:MAG: SCP2 sterol-binding domain-containing protein [Burkholderiales bacterium]|nr:SCP2 sterol-binding domain-containing protein [Burkholderiales bacterium]